MRSIFLELLFALVGCYLLIRYVFLPGNKIVLRHGRRQGEEEVKYID